MSQASQLLIDKPQAPQAGAAVSSPREPKSGDNSRFSSVLGDKVSQAEEASAPPDSTPAGKSEPVSTAEREGNGLQNNAASGKVLPQQAAEVAEDILAHDTVITALSDVSPDTDDAGLLKSEAGTSLIAGEDSTPTGVTRSPAKESSTVGSEAQAIDAESLASVVDEATVIPLPAAAVNLEQGTAGEARVASTVGHSSPVASLVANANKGQAVATQQAANTGEESELDALLPSEGDEDESLTLKQQKGEFSTKLRGLVDQVKRALGVYQNTATSQSNPVTNGAPPVTAYTQLTTDVTTTTNTVSTSVNIGLKQEGWDDAMGQRVQWMVSKGIQKADIRLNPANLGPLEVRVNMTDDGADVRFISQHGVVRDSVESAMPRLREMLAEQGIDLANVDVSEHSIAQDNGQQDSGQQGTDKNGHGLTDADSASQDAGLVANTRVSEGMLDMYA